MKFIMKKIVLVLGLLFLGSNVLDAATRQPFYDYNRFSAGVFENHVRSVKQALSKIGKSLRRRIVNGETSDHVKSIAAAVRSDIELTCRRTLEDELIALRGIWGQLQRDRDAVKEYYDYELWRSNDNYAKELVKKDQERITGLLKDVPSLLSLGEKVHRACQPLVKADTVNLQEEALKPIRSEVPNWLSELDKLRVENRSNSEQVLYSAKVSIHDIAVNGTSRVAGNTFNFVAGPYDRNKIFRVGACAALFVLPLWSDYLAAYDEAKRFSPDEEYSFMTFVKHRYGTKFKILRALKTEKKFWPLYAAALFLTMPLVKAGFNGIFTPERKQSIADSITSLWSGEKADK